MSKPRHPEAHIFPVETRFQTMAVRPGGVPRDLALERAEEHIEAIKPEFSDWLADEVKNLSAAARQIAKHPSDLAYLEEVRGGFCQLRDIGTTMGFELTSIISNNLCEILDGMRTGAAYQDEIIECHLDALVLTSKPPYCNLRPDQLPEMTSGLRRVVEIAAGVHPHESAEAATRQPRE